MIRDIGKFEKVKKEIEKIISHSPCEEDPGHSKLTLKWLLKLKPEADETLQIAALAHDVERGTGKDKWKEDFTRYKECKQKHAKRSAKIIGDILRKYQYDKDMIRQVEKLVRKHEVGGDKDTDVLKNADSISFFDYNIYFFYKAMGEEKTKYKIRYMFERTSPHVKKEILNLKFKKPVREVFTKVIKE